jgi:hypothetical protein
MTHCGALSVRSFGLRVVSTINADIKSKALSGAAAFNQSLQIVHNDVPRTSWRSTRNTFGDRRNSFLCRDNPPPKDLNFTNAPKSLLISAAAPTE